MGAISERSGANRTASRNAVQRSARKEQVTVVDDRVLVALQEVDVGSILIGVISR